MWPTSADVNPTATIAAFAAFAAHREKVGPGYPLMVDCYMSLDVPYAVRPAEACEPLDIYWWEEALHPDDVEGFRLIKQAHPTIRWTTGEHGYSRYGFRRLIEERLTRPTANTLPPARTGAR